LVKIARKLGNKGLARPSILLKAAFLALSSGILASCAAPKQLGESEKSVLIQRVAERWRCLERNDYACAYAFRSPAYRQVYSYEMYRNRYFSALDRRLTGIKVVAYDSGAAVASVRVGVMSMPLKSTSSASRAIGITPTTLTEAWLWGDGEWWYSENP
jgi:hypothetical protein